MCSPSVNPMRPGSRRSPNGSTPTRPGWTGRAARSTRSTTTSATRPRHALGGRAPDPQHDTKHRNGAQRLSGSGFVTPVPVRWSDIDMYQHVNHATMVTMLEEARIPFLANAFGADITTTGLLIAEVKVTYKGQLRLVDSPLQVTIWTNRLRAVDFTLGYEVRSVNADPELQAGRDRRNAVGGVRHRRAAAGAAVPGSPRVSRSGGCDSRARTVAARRGGPRRPDDVRERALRLDDAAGEAGRARSAGDGLGGNRFRCAGLPGGGSAGCDPTICRRGPTRWCAAVRPLDAAGYVDTGLRDGFGLAGRAAARDRASSTSTTSRPG